MHKIEVFYFNDRGECIEVRRHEGPPGDFQRAIKMTANKFVIVTLRDPEGGFLNAHRNFDREQNKLILL